MIIRRAALALALALLPVSAAAQPSDTAKASARALAQQGQDALDRQDFTTAADRFGRAAELLHAPTLAVGLARAQVGLGKLVAAQETYNRVVRESLPPGSPPAFTKAVAAAKKELEALEPRIPTLVIQVKGPAAARITIDGAPLPNALIGVSVPVDPGTHTIRAEGDGFAPGQATVTSVERRGETVTLVLTPGGPPPSAQPVVAPVVPPPTAPVGVAATPAPPAPAQGGSIRKTLGFVGIGVGGASLVMGGVTGGLALSKHGDLKTGCPASTCPPTEYGALDNFHLLSTLSTVGFVAGGVLAAAGVVLVATAPKTGATTGLRVAPVLGGGTAALTGEF
jgi:hypothetical protein